MNITHPLEEGNDGPSIDASVNKSSNMYNKKEGGDQIDSLEDSDDSKGSCEVTKGQSKEIETQVNYTVGQIITIIGFMIVSKYKITRLFGQTPLVVIQMLLNLSQVSTSY